VRLIICLLSGWILLQFWRHEPVLFKDVLLAVFIGWLTQAIWQGKGK
jgi:hypothetical protein